MQVEGLNAGPAHQGDNGQVSKGQRIGCLDKLMQGGSPTQADGVEVIGPVFDKGCQGLAHIGLGLLLGLFSRGNDGGLQVVFFQQAFAGF